MPNADNQYEFAPWPEPVNVNELVEEIFTVIERIVYLKCEQILAVVYWVIHTYFIRQKGERQAFRYSPILLLTSPVYGCGKTVLQDLLAELSNKSKKAANISMSSVFRLLHAQQPTLFLDEIDTYFQNREELIGFLNAVNHKVVLLSEYMTFLRKTLKSSQTFGANAYGSLLITRTH